MIQSTGWTTANQGSQDPTARMVHCRAVEVVIWGMLTPSPKRGSCP